MMRKLCGSVLLAWIFCFIISAAALVTAAQTFAQGLPNQQPLTLASDKDVL